MRSGVMHLRILFAVCATGGLLLASGPDASASSRVPFVENVGQLARAEVGYYAELASGTVFVTKDGDVVYSLPCPRTAGTGNDAEPARWAFRESFARGGALHPAGADPSPILVSSFTGPRPEGWHPRLPAFGRVDLGEVVPGIRVDLRAAGGNVEKVIHVAPGARLSALRIAVEGVRGLRLDGEGRLAMETDRGDVAFTAPAAHQVIDDRRRDVDVAYVLADGAYGFELGAHDPEREVVVDPLLASTFLGGHNPSPPGNYDDDIVETIATVDGLVYVAGATQSPDFPVQMGYDESLASNFPDAFVALMTDDLSTVVAATFLGTTSSDRVRAIAIDPTGSVVIAATGRLGIPRHSGRVHLQRNDPRRGRLRRQAQPRPLDAAGVRHRHARRLPEPARPRQRRVLLRRHHQQPRLPRHAGSLPHRLLPARRLRHPALRGLRRQDLGRPDDAESLTYLGGNVVSGIAVADDGTVFYRRRLRLRDHRTPGALRRRAHDVDGLPELLPGQHQRQQRAPTSTAWRSTGTRSWPWGRRT